MHHPLKTITLGFFGMLVNSSSASFMQILSKPIADLEFPSSSLSNTNTILLLEAREKKFGWENKQRYEKRTQKQNIFFRQLHCVQTRRENIFAYSGFGYEAYPGRM